MSEFMRGLGMSGVGTNFFGKARVDELREQNNHERFMFGARLDKERHGFLKEDRAREAEERDFAEVSGIAADLFAVPQEDGSVRRATMDDIFADPNKGRDLERVMKSRYASKTFFQDNEFVRIQDMGDGTSTIVLRNKEGKEVPLTRDGVQDPNDPNYGTDPVRVFKPEDLGGLLAAVEHDLTRTGRNFTNAENEIHGVGGEQPQRSATESYLRTGQSPQMEQPETTDPGLGNTAPGAVGAVDSALAPPEPDPTPVVSRVTDRLGLGDSSTGGDGRGRTQLAGGLGTAPQAGYIAPDPSVGGNGRGLEAIDAPLVTDTAESGPRMVRVGTLPDGRAHMKPANEGPDLADRTLGAASRLVGQTSAMPLQVGYDIATGKSAGEAVGSNARDIYDAGVEAVNVGKDVVAAGAELAQQTGDALVSATSRFAADVRTGFGALPQSKAADKVPDVPLSEVKPESVPQLTWESFSAAADLGKTLDDAEARAETPEGRQTIQQERVRMGNTAVNMVVPGAGPINTRRMIKGYAMMINAGLMTPQQADTALGNRIRQSEATQIDSAKAQATIAKNSREGALADQRLRNALLDQLNKTQTLAKGEVELSEARRGQYEGIAESATPAIMYGLIASGIQIPEKGEIEIGGQVIAVEDLMAAIFEGFVQDGAATGFDFNAAVERGQLSAADRRVVTALTVKKATDLMQNRQGSDGIFGGQAVNRTLDPVVADGQSFEVKTSSGNQKMSIQEIVNGVRARFADKPEMRGLSDEEIAARIRRSPAEFGIVSG